MRIRISYTGNETNGLCGNARGKPLIWLSTLPCVRLRTTHASNYGSRKNRRAYTQRLRCLCSNQWLIAGENCSMRIGRRRRTLSKRNFDRTATDGVSIEAFPPSRKKRSDGNGNEGERKGETRRLYGYFLIFFCVPFSTSRCTDTTMFANLDQQTMNPWLICSQTMD